MVTEIIVFFFHDDTLIAKLMSLDNPEDNFSGLRPFGFLKMSNPYSHDGFLNGQPTFQNMNRTQCVTPNLVPQAFERDINGAVQRGE